ncbi:22497_t:CDS:2, partial [Racocetra persica]
EKHIEWVEELRKRHMAVSQNIVIRKARSLANTIEVKNIHPNIINFSFSIMISMTHEFTPSGRIKKPSYSTLAQWVLESTKHAKCSEEAICTNCASHNLECIYVKPVKKRGPKAANRSTNVFEDNSDKAPNIEQEHSSTQFSVSIPFYLDYNYNEEFYPIQSGCFSHINTNDIMLGNSGKAPNIEQEHSSIQFSVPIPFYLDYNYNEEFQPIQNGCFSHINNNEIMLDNSGEAPNIEQECTLTQFSVPIPFYPGYNYNEEFQPIQNGCFSHINNNDIMLDNSGEAPNIGQEYSLTQFSFLS